MNAIEKWNEIVLAYRKASLNNGNHWHGDHARWYDGWVKVNNYAEEIYPLFKPFVHGLVLEIGAGTGLFTQYLVQDAEQLHVLEPSVDMLDLLRSNVSSRQKLSCFNTTIEEFDFQTRHYDFTFAAHAFFNVLQIDWYLSKILDHSDVLGVLIGNGKPLDVFQVFRVEGLVEESRARPPHHMNLIPVLEACGFHYDLYQVQTAIKYVYRHEDDLLEKIAAQCAIRPEKQQIFREMIFPHIQRNEQGVFVQGKRTHVCLLIGKDRVEFHKPDPAK